MVLGMASDNGFSVKDIPAYVQVAALAAAGIGYFIHQKSKQTPKPNSSQGRNQYGHGETITPVYDGHR